MSDALASMMRALLASVLLILAAVAGPAAAQPLQPITHFDGNAPSGRYAFSSSTPKTLADLAQGAGGTVTVTGQLFMPPGEEKVPAVVLLHGSGGIYEALLDFWPKQFESAGFATFVPDMFGSRGVSSAAEDQSLVPMAADMADAFGALRLLATHPRIDPQRIAVMGFSRGGIAALRVGVEKIIAGQKLPEGLRFAALIPTYGGGCAGIVRLVVKPGVFSTSPILFIHGDADDFTPIAPCRDYAQRIREAGTPVRFEVIPGAQHKFDSDDLSRHYLRSAARTKADCPIEIDVDTLAAFDRNTGARLRGADFQQAMRDCRATGATVEGNRDARDQAARAALAFLREVFAR